MEKLREHITLIDETIIEFLAMRMQVARLIGQRKRNRGIPVRDAGREEALMERLKKYAGERGLPPEFVERMYELVFEESRRLQER